MTHRDITNDDLHSAIRGLGMWGMSVDELDALIEAHVTQTLFASRVIAEAARQVLAWRRVCS